MLLVPALWFHLSIELVQARAQQQGRTWPAAGAAARRLAIALAYAAGVALMLLSILWFGNQPNPITSAGLHAAGRAKDPLYPFTTAYVLVLASLSLANLWRGYRYDSSEVRRRQFRPLFIATLLAALGGVYVTVGIGLGIDLPELPRDIAFGVAVALLGFAVARHNALVEGRVIEADLLYVFLAIGSLTAVAVLLAELLYSAGHVFSFVTLVLVMAVTICVLMLYDGVRTALDRLLYRDQFRQLRANLRSLANEAGTGLSLPEQLQAVLDRLCATLGAERGLIALAGDGSHEWFVVRASHNAAPVGREIPAARLLRAEIVALPLGPAGPAGADAMDGMALLAPIAAGGSQAGAVLLGPRSGQQPYEDEDLMLLDDVASQLAAVVHTSRLQEENARAINAMVSEFRERERAMQRQVQEMLAAGSAAAAEPDPAGLSQEAFTGQVEDALRRLHDYPALGEHPLARLALVRQSMAASHADGAGTHIERGKALHRVLVEAIDKLRPEGVPPNPHSVPPREWRQFIILHDSYVLDEPNRDIMSRLYIGEGTFNRTRRRALQGVAKALQEMEEAI
jgi:GAF domain-containing protein